MVRRPVDSSMRSRQTGHVGSSINAGVGGACGLEERELDEIGAACGIEGVEDTGCDMLTEGVNGSFVMSGKEAS